MTKRERLHPEIVRLREQGLTFREIGERFGLSLSTVQDYYSDPTGEKVRARKAKFGGTCVECGAPTTYALGGPTERCVACGNVARGQAQTIWTPQVIIRAIHAWAAEYGEPPAMPDWNPTHARVMGDESRARRFEQADGRWPVVMTVIRAFGTWNAAIRAAGYEPRVAGGGGGNYARRRSVRERVAA